MGVASAPGSYQLSVHGDRPLDSGCMGRMGRGPNIESQLTRYGLTLIKEQESITTIQ